MTEQYQQYQRYQYQQSQYQQQYQPYAHAQYQPQQYQQPQYQQSQYQQPQYQQTSLDVPLDQIRKPVEPTQRSICLKNVPPTITELDLQSAFEIYGEIDQIKVLLIINIFIRWFPKKK